MKKLTFQNFNISKVYSFLRAYHSAINNCVFIKYLELIPVFNSSDNFFYICINATSFSLVHSSIPISEAPVSFNGYR